MKRRTLLGSIVAALCFWKTVAKADTQTPIMDEGTDSSATLTPRYDVVAGAVCYETIEGTVVCVPDVHGEGVWYSKIGLHTVPVIDTANHKLIDWTACSFAARVVMVPWASSPTGFVPHVAELSSPLCVQEWTQDRGIMYRSDRRYTKISGITRYNKSVAHARKKT